MKYLGSEVLLACVFYAVLAPGRVHCAPDESVTSVVVLVRMGECCPAEAWLDAEESIVKEFVVLGIAVVSVDGVAVDERSRRLELHTLAREHKAACSIRIVTNAQESGAGVELWIEDLVTGKTISRTLDMDETESREAADIAALRTVELLRASLLELRSSTPPPNPVSPPKEVEALMTFNDEQPENDETRFLVGAGMSVLGSPGGVGPMGAIFLDVGWLPVSAIIIGLDVSVSVFGRDLEKGSESSTFDVAMARAWFDWQVKETGFLRPILGLGAGFALAWTEGSSTIHDNVSTETATSAWMGTRTALALVFHENVRLRMALGVGFLLSGMSVYFGDERIAGFGKPTIEGSLGLELHL